MTEKEKKENKTKKAVEKTKVPKAKAKPKTESTSTSASAPTSAPTPASAQKTSKTVKKGQAKEKASKKRSDRTRKNVKTIKTTGRKKKAKTVTVSKSEQPKKVQTEVFIPGIKEVKIYSITGKSTRKIKLPIAFDETYRLDLIRRAVKAARANHRQPYGPSPRSGMSHSTKTWGKGRGSARVQRIVDGRRAVESPNNVGGRRAHPPTLEKVWTEKINKKERKKARRAALAAISQTELVANRGHKFDNKLTLPLILEDEFENTQKTKKAIEIFQNIGVYDDVLRAANGKHIRAGKGKGRGRKYRIPRSILVVATNPNDLKRGIGNLAGVDLVTPDKLSIEDLAPGGDPGRLTIFTESALKQIGSW